jgi:hypothetical protein
MGARDITSKGKRACVPHSAKKKVSKKRIPLKSGPESMVGTHSKFSPNHHLIQSTKLGLGLSMGARGITTTERTAYVPHSAKKKVVEKRIPQTGKPMDKPRRPLSAYNIFFKSERAKMMEEAANITRREGSNDKRVRSGKIGFEVLAKTIAKKWKELTEEEMEVYKRQAEEELTRYKNEKEEYNQNHAWKRIANLLPPYFLSERDIALFAPPGPAHPAFGLKSKNDSSAKGVVGPPHFQQFRTHNYMGATQLVADALPIARVTPQGASTSHQIMQQNDWARELANRQLPDLLCEQALGRFNNIIPTPVPSALPYDQRLASESLRAQSVSTGVTSDMPAFRTGSSDTMAEKVLPLSPLTAVSEQMHLPGTYLHHLLLLQDRSRTFPGVLSLLNSTDEATLRSRQPEVELSYNRQRVLAAALGMSQLSSATVPQTADSADLLDRTEKKHLKAATHLQSAREFAFWSEKDRNPRLPPLNEKQKRQLQEYLDFASKKQIREPRR